MKSFRSFIPVYFVLSITLTVLFLTASVRSSAIASGSVIQLIVPDGQQTVHELLEIEIRVTQAVNLAAWEFDLSYDPELIQIDRLTPHSFFGNEQSCQPTKQRCVLTLGPLDASANKIALGGVSYGQNVGVNGDGVLAVLRVRPTGRGGKSALTITNPRFVDLHGNLSIPASQDEVLVLGQQKSFYLPLITR
ncbi:cohesin domain-containing protein [Chloroflexi bacterium TSY]|nr:cohesin domain-containing protein [Chloroflexi bacterium TSY]